MRSNGFFGAPAQEEQGAPTKHQVSPSEIATMQALLDIQRSLGEMQSDIKSLNSKIESTDKKLDKIDDKLSGVTHKVYAAGIVLTITLVIGGFAVNKGWDFLAKHVTPIEQKP